LVFRGEDLERGRKGFGVKKKKYETASGDSRKKRRKGWKRGIKRTWGPSFLKGRKFQDKTKNEQMGKINKKKGGFTNCWKNLGGKNEEGKKGPGNLNSEGRLTRRFARKLNRAIKGGIKGWGSNWAEIVL